MSLRTYYDILDVPRSATTAEIKTAFRRQAVLWHPDRNPKPNATARFREISEAYQCLNDAGARTRYDDGLRRAEEAAARARSSGARVCEEYPPCVPCAFDRLWAEFKEEFTIRPENVIALFVAIECAIRRVMARLPA